MTRAGLRGYAQIINTHTHTPDSSVRKARCLYTRIVPRANGGGIGVGGENVEGNGVRGGNGDEDEGGDGSSEDGNGDGDENGIGVGGGEAKMRKKMHNNCRRDQAFSFRTRHHLCKQGVALAGTR